MEYTLDDAQGQLTELFSVAQQGKTVLIVDEQGRAVKLVPTIVPVKPAKLRKAGSARGKVKIADDFDAPLPEFAPYADDFDAPLPEFAPYVE